MNRQSYKTGTHLPVLMEALARVPEGDVLELGGGANSTPFLHWACYRQGQRKLVTVENDPEYFACIAPFAAPWHDVVAVRDWDHAPIERPWGIALVDHEPAARRKVDLQRLLPWATVIVVHDVDGRSNRYYDFASVWPDVRYYWQWSAVRPRTAVVSQWIDVRGWTL